MRRVIGLLSVLLPWPLRRFVLTRLCGHSLAPGSRIGLSLVLADAMHLGAGARIGHFTVIKGLHRLEMGTHSSIGHFNWITGFPLRASAVHFTADTQRDPSLRLGDESAITNRHLIDCTDSVRFGHHTTFAGFRSQILSHSIDIATAVQRARPVAVGDYCFVGTGCILLAGSCLPARSVLGAGSVLQRAFDEPGWLYAGAPARPVKALPADAAYFHRPSGFVY